MPRSLRITLNEKWTGPCQRSWLYPWSVLSLLLFIFVRVHVEVPITLSETPLI